MMGTTMELVKAEQGHDVELGRDSDNDAKAPEHDDGDASVQSVRIKVDADVGGDGAAQLPAAPAAPRKLSPVLHVLLLLFSVAAGAGLTVQAAFNGVFLDNVGHGLPSTVMSFTSATIMLYILTAKDLRNVRRLWQRDSIGGRPRAWRWWFSTPGLMGAIIVLVAIVLSKLIGFAIVFVTVVAGQLTASAVMDFVGFPGLPRRQVGPARVVGIAIVLAGAVVSVVQLADYKGGLVELVVLCAVGVFSGLLRPLQGGVNANVGTVVGSDMLATTLSFSGGLLALLLCCLPLYLVDSALVGKLAPAFTDTPWWIFLTGSFGVVFVTAAASVPKIIGFSAFFVCATAGQLGVSLVLDHYGALGNTVREASAIRVGGVLLAVAGTVIAQLPPGTAHRLLAALQRRRRRSLAAAARAEGSKAAEEDATAAAASAAAAALAAEEADEEAAERASSVMMGERPCRRPSAETYGNVGSEAGSEAGGPLGDSNDGDSDDGGQRARSVNDGTGSGSEPSSRESPAALVEDDEAADDAAAEAAAAAAAAAAQAEAEARGAAAASGRVGSVASGRSTASGREELEDVQLMC